MTRRASALLVAALVGALLPVASADDAAEARFHDALGREAYARRRFEDALAHFLDANSAAPSPLTAYNVALSADLAGHDVLAFHFFEQYLATPDDDAARGAEARRRRDRLAERLALVRIESEPSGAAIAVDRAELGDWGSTPRTIAVSPGPHRIVLGRDDHEDVALEVEARAGELRTLSATLPARTGSVVVDVEPVDARVLVLRGMTQLAETRTGVPVDVPVGPCVVRVELEGHRSAETAVVVRAGVATRARLVATPLPIPRGRLLVRTTEGSARVLVDGAPRGSTPLVLRAEPVGRHRVEIEAAGYVRWSGDVVVREGRSSHVTVTLTPGR